MMPNLDKAENKHTSSVTIFYDMATKKYGIRQSEEIIRDGVHIEATKNIVMTREELEKIVSDAATFLRDRS